MKLNFNPVQKLKQFYDDSKRLLSVSYKPSNEEFKRTLKIVLFCTLILGVVGFVISIIVGLIV
ncbi:MAG: protein translocase SEC61 complex subunit gamma [Candidatus Micrarchaeales archaeon]|jgi:protein translocase SEC61 complex gamma subunit